MKRLIAGQPGFTAEEMKILAGTSPHALRHTSGTHAIAEELPLDVCLTHLGTLFPADHHDLRASGEATDAAERPSFSGSTNDCPGASA